MFNCKKVFIKDIKAVVYVAPPQNSYKRSYYGPRLRHYELVYFISSESRTFFDGKVIHNKPGRLEFLPKTDYDVEYYVDRTVPGDCIDIHFDTDYPLPKEAMSLDASENKSIRQLFVKINQLWLSKKDGYYYSCISIFYQILAEIEKCQSSYMPQDKFDKIKDGIEYISKHCYDEEMDYSKPSELCGISYSYFKRLFIEKFSVPPKEYVSKMRLERAAELLRTGYYSVTETAQTVGYSNVYYFSKIFKEKYGCPPSRYKI